MGYRAKFVQDARRKILLVRQDTIGSRLHQNFQKVPICKNWSSQVGNTPSRNQSQIFCMIVRLLKQSPKPRIGSRSSIEVVTIANSNKVLEYNVAIDTPDDIEGSTRKNSAGQKLSNETHLRFSMDAIVTWQAMRTIFFQKVKHS